MALLAKAFPVPGSRPSARCRANSSSNLASAPSKSPWARARWARWPRMSISAPSAQAAPANAAGDQAQPLAGQRDQASLPQLARQFERLAAGCEGSLPLPLRVEHAGKPVEGRGSRSIRDATGEGKRALQPGPSLTEVAACPP